MRKWILFLVMLCAGCARDIRNGVGRAKGYGGCGRCGGTWDHTPNHTTKYSEWGGCFPLCEKCWSELTPKTRLPYYEALGREWFRWCGSMNEQQEHEAKMVQIREAVLAGR